MFVKKVSGMLDDLKVCFNWKDIKQPRKNWIVSGLPVCLRLGKLAFIHICNQTTSGKFTFKKYIKKNDEFETLGQKF